MVWCPVDHCYYCGRCYRDGCMPVHGKGPAAKAQYRLVGLVLLLFFGTALLPPALAAIVLSGDPANGMDVAWLGVLFLGLFGSGAAWFLITSWIRGFGHREFVKDHLAPAASPSDDARDPALDWKENHAAAPRRLMTLVPAAAILSGSGVLLFMWSLLVAPPNIALSASTVSGILVAVGAMAAFFAVLPVAVPSAVAVGAEGIHLWYDSAVDRRTQTDEMKWTRLAILGMQSQAGGDPAKRLVRLMRIDSENAEVIYAAWQKRRLVQPAPRRVATVSTPLASPTTALAPPLPGGTLLLSRAGQGSHRGFGVTCARCHVRFPGLEGLRLLWCKVDRFYVCRRCWEDGCQEGHGKGVRARSKPARIASAVVVAALFFALFYPGVAYDFTLRNVWTGAAVVPISDLQAGQVVKVQGIIAPGPDIAIGGYEVSSKNGWYWQWDTNDGFTLLDASGSIPVSTAEWYIYYNGPYPAPNAYHIEVGDYTPGDMIQIVGTVVQAPRGGVELLAQIVSLASAAPLITLAPSPTSAVLMWVLPLLVVAILVAGVAFFMVRRIAHRRATRGEPTYSIRGDSETRDPRLDWQPNGKGTRPRRRAALALAALGFGLSLLGVYAAYRPQSAWGNGGFWFAGLIILIVETALVYMLLFGGVGRPGFVAVADEGFRMWFDSPYDRHLNDTVFPWDQIRDIHLTGGKTPHWVLRWTTGEATNLYMLNRSSLNLLLEEWTRRRMPAPS